ncbi:MAG: helix-turn-helix transcriptional regulator [Spirochaetota bacterium]|nr:helix-turn-helix transcriptional regulator [Spirochaetota bacterium]
MKTWDTVGKLEVSLEGIKDLSRDPKTAIRWLSENIDKGEILVGKAKAEYQFLEECLKDLNKLVRYYVQREELGLDEEDVESLLETAFDLVHDMETMGESTVTESEDLFELEKRLLKTDNEYRKASEELDKEEEYFLRRYTELKASKGIKTQEEMARRSGISQSYISVIESGKHRPQMRTLVKLAETFGVDVNELWYSSE